MSAADSLFRQSETEESTTKFGKWHNQTKQMVEELVRERVTDFLSELQPTTDTDFYDLSKEEFVDWLRSIFNLLSSPTKSTQELAAQLGLDFNSASDWLGGKNIPTDANKRNAILRLALVNIQPDKIPAHNLVKVLNQSN